MVKPYFDTESANPSTARPGGCFGPVEVGGALQNEALPVALGQYEVRHFTP